MAHFAILFINILLLFHLDAIQAASEPRISPGYSQEPRCSSDELNPSWMASIPDDRPLQLISIPGTHDSFARIDGETFIPHYLQTQTMKMADQLAAGIRAFDIRCRHINDECYVYHKSVDQFMTLGEILQISEKFLKENPTEVVLLRVKDGEKGAFQCKSEHG